VLAGWNPDQALWRGVQHWISKVQSVFSAMSSLGRRSQASPSERLPPNQGEQLAMPLQFHRAVENMEIWSATCDDYSFVISFESFAGPGFHGRPGYVASWRPLYRGRGAIKIIGSPFKSFDEAEAACDAMLKHLTSEN
jgi:hypothetical protein